ncbi:hypothetical protein TNCT_419592 [Trichonephila clavata]|uniref:Uncharacterized protein n=1 Tax=Trichonephila clavata TaxID=2740835 RepID=A0A8X6ILQ1_TRICU|nr:hypothetical protein TNCT_419592 [Trichonephila clavata]
MIGSKMSSWIFVAFLLSPFILPEIQCDPVAAMLVDNMYGIRGRMNNLRNNVEPQIMEFQVLCQVMLVRIILS